MKKEVNHQIKVTRVLEELKKAGINLSKIAREKNYSQIGVAVLDLNEEIRPIAGDYGILKHFDCRKLNFKNDVVSQVFTEVKANNKEIECEDLIVIKNVKKLFKGVCLEFSVGKQQTDYVRKIKVKDLLDAKKRDKEYVSYNKKERSPLTNSEKLNENIQRTEKMSKDSEDNQISVKEILDELRAAKMGKQTKGDERFSNQIGVTIIDHNRMFRRLDGSDGLINFDCRSLDFKKDVVSQVYEKLRNSKGIAGGDTIIVIKKNNGREPSYTFNIGKTATEQIREVSLEKLEQARKKKQENVECTNFKTESLLISGADVLEPGNFTFPTNDIEVSKNSKVADNTILNSSSNISTQPFPLYFEGDLNQKNGLDRNNPNGGPDGPDGPDDPDDLGNKHNRKK